MQQPKRKRGAQPGNSNAVTHGRFSAAVRAARRAELHAAWEEQKRRSKEWHESQPPIDYAAICAAIKAKR